MPVDLELELFRAIFDEATISLGGVVVNNSDHSPSMTILFMVNDAIVDSIHFGRLTPGRAHPFEISYGLYSSGDEILAEAVLDDEGGRFFDPIKENNIGSFNGLISRKVTEQEREQEYLARIEERTREHIQAVTAQQMGELTANYAPLSGDHVVLFFPHAERHNIEYDTLELLDRSYLILQDIYGGSNIGGCGDPEIIGYFQQDGPSHAGCPIVITSLLEKGCVYCTVTTIIHEMAHNFSWLTEGSWWVPPMVPVEEAASEVWTQLGVVPHGWADFGEEYVVRTILAEYHGDFPESTIFLLEHVPDLLDASSRAFEHYRNSGQFDDNFVRTGLVSIYAELFQERGWDKFVDVLHSIKRITEQDFPVARSQADRNGYLLASIDYALGMSVQPLFQMLGEEAPPIDPITYALAAAFLNSTEN